MPESRAKPLRVLWGLFWLINISLLVWAWADFRLGTIADGGGYALVAIGALFGLIGAYLLLTQMILISGVPPLERVFGLDRLARIHHKNGRYAYLLIMAHVVLIVLGYSILYGNNPVSQLLEIRSGFPYVTLAVFAVLALNIVFFTSIYIVWKSLKYEWWRAIHLLVYAVVLLAFLHQINNGVEFQRHDPLRYYWWVLYFGALAIVLLMRWGQPLWLQARYRFVVERVDSPARDVTSIYVSGRNLQKFRYRAGQFNFWIFLRRGMLFQKHPFTISSSPGDPYLRLSAKAIGDFTAELPSIRPGTRAIVAGPFGRFTMAKSSGRPRLFIAGGIGITPIRSMLGESVLKGDILLFTARTAADLAFKEELESLIKKGLRLYYILSDSKKAGGRVYAGYLEKELIAKLVPDASKRDVWLCGPPPMMDKVQQSLIELGVPKKRIHTERFRL